jgi:hypothetical protein
MGRPRVKETVEVYVSINSIPIPAYLRPPEGKRATYELRWKIGGRWRDKSTGETIRHEAIRAAEEIIRGKTMSSSPKGLLTVDSFIGVQEKHFANKPHKKKGDKSLKKFKSDFANFCRFFKETTGSDLTHIQQATEQTAVRYLDWLKAGGYEPRGILSKVSSLRSAWNRVRKGHCKATRRLHDEDKVKDNPWEMIAPDLPKIEGQVDPIQLDLGRGDFQKLYEAFVERPIAQLFLVVSFWAAGRLEEMSLAEWDWVVGEQYIDIPDAVAKWGKGRVVRIPPVIMEALRQHRLEGSPYIFAGYTAELRRLSKRHGRRIRDYHAGTFDLICKQITRKAARAGLVGVTHHALRATAMELSDQGEELKASDRSSKNLGTTTRNKQGFYVRKSHGRTFYLRADGLYQSLSEAFREWSAVAKVLGVEAPKTEVDALLESIKGMGDAERDALLSALGVQPKGKRKRTG